MGHSVAHSENYIDSVVEVTFCSKNKEKKSVLDELLL